MSGLVPGYEWLQNPRSAGNAYADASYHPYRPIILLHMTVGMSASRSYIRGHSSPPHLWANPYNGDKFQTVPLDRAALALYQPQFGYHWTNRHRYLLQTELIGVPQVSVATYTDAQDRWIGEQVIAPQARWLRGQGLSIDLTQVLYHANTSGSASEYWGGRMTEAEMANYGGIMCHIDAWGNDHWDCSAERVDKWAEYARAALGPIGGGGVVTVSLKGRLDQVGRGTDDRVWHRSRDATGGWSPWSRLGSLTTEQPVSVAWHTDKWLHIYAVGTDNNLYECSWSEGSGWVDFHLTEGQFLSGVFTVGT